jgi:hypothetical protein
VVIIPKIQSKKSGNPLHFLLIGAIIIRIVADKPSQRAVHGSLGQLTLNQGEYANADKLANI